MIIVTGAAGFIGSCLIQRLNNDNFKTIIAVDDFSRKDKLRNLDNKKIMKKIDRGLFFKWLDKNYREVEFIFHIGARTDTTEMSSEIFQKLNIEYSKNIWKRCCDYQIPLIYASSAATYGNGKLGFDDNEKKIQNLKPLNPYACSKQTFDLWALAEKEKPFFWAGLKFFNVYGPNEYHKNRMASVIWHGYNQIKKNGEINLFRSHNNKYKDGEQLRDFIYIKDLLDVCVYLMHLRKDSGIFNLGTGQARTFNDLALAIFNSMKMKKKITYIDIPEKIRDNYQYFTQAKTKKLLTTGYTGKFYSMEDGVHDYIQNYLSKNNYF